jgi:hypothetical protein
MSASERGGYGAWAGMGAGRFPWLMRRQRLLQSSPETIADLPAARMIWDEDPHVLLGLLGLGAGRHMPPSANLADLGCLRAEVEDQGD